MTGFSHVQLLVRDVPASERWYSTVLGMDRLTAADDDSYVALRHRPSRVVVVLTAGEPGGGRAAGPPRLRRARRPDPGGLGRRAHRPGASTTPAWSTSWASPPWSCRTPTATTSNWWRRRAPERIGWVASRSTLRG